jgi:hypothetical protein
MRNRIRQRMLRRMALAFAVAAVAAPTALAHPLEPGSSTPHGTTIPQQYGMPTAMPSDYAAIRGDGIENVRLQDRTGYDVRGLDGVESVRLQDRTGYDLRGSDGVENVRVEPRGLDKPVLVVSDGSSFDWSDAGIGAGLAFAAMLLAGGAALSVKQSNRLGQV